MKSGGDPAPAKSTAAALIGPLKDQIALLALLPVGTGAGGCTD